MTDLELLLKFTKFTHEFQQVKRMVLVNGENRLENDSEHSFQVAMLCWYFIELKHLKYDINKVLKYALVHDLVEAYAGDTFFYGNREGKEEREKIAFEKMKKEFSEFTEMLTCIENYEKQLDSESKFVKAFEKIIPPLNIYLDNGRTWKDEKHKITLEKLVKNKTPKVIACEDLIEIWDEFTKLLTLNKDMFYTAATD